MRRGRWQWGFIGVSQTERGSVASNVGALKFARKRSEGYFRENNREEEDICVPTWGRAFW
jgi:hypothetical protein